MRFLLIRLRENAESIAFYGAEGQELTALTHALTRIVRVTMGRVRVMGLYDLFVNAYNYMSIIGAWGFGVPVVFWGGDGGMGVGVGWKERVALTVGGG